MVWMAVATSASSLDDDAELLTCTTCSAFVPEDMSDKSATGVMLKNTTIGHCKD